MPDVFSPEVRSKIMGKIRSKNTKPEKIVRRVLFQQGFRFKIHNKELPGKPDIVLIRYKTAIFVNGCFWHGHTCRDGKKPKTNLSYWEPKLKGNKDRDKSNKKDIKKMGWLVITIWECQTKNEISILRKIKRLIELRGQMLKKN